MNVLYIVLYLYNKYTQTVFYKHIHIYYKYYLIRVLLEPYCWSRGAKHAKSFGKHCSRTSEHQLTKEWRFLTP